MDELKDELQSKIADYSKMAESGKKTKPKETGFMALSEEISLFSAQRKVHYKNSSDGINIAQKKVFH